MLIVQSVALVGFTFTTLYNAMATQIGKKQLVTHCTDKI